MLKVTIKGEVFSFDHERYPLSEAIELEEGLGISFHEYRLGLQVGSAKAMAGFVWVVFRRNGKDVPLDDILSGAYELATSDVSTWAHSTADRAIGMDWNRSKMPLFISR